MYLFFMICGYIFVTSASIVLIYLFELFSINAFTKFLNPLEKSTFNNVGISIFPNIIWAVIELIAISTNKMFIVGFLMNVFVTMSLMYVIQNGYEMVTKKESEVVKPISIFISCFFGFICNYMCLLIGVKHEIHSLASILLMIALTSIYILIKLYPPKIEFFKGIEE